MLISLYKSIPNDLKNKTTGQVIASFFTPPVGTLIAAMVSTFGIYLFASILYVSPTQLYLTSPPLTGLRSVILGTCSPVSSSTCVWLPASPTLSTFTHSATCMTYLGVLKAPIKPRHFRRFRHPKERMKKLLWFKTQSVCRKTWMLCLRRP